MRKQTKPASVKANCKDCLHASGYEDYLTTCNVFNLKRPYGTRKCESFKAKIKCKA